MTPEQFRSLFPVTKRAVYLNNAAITPMAEPIRTALTSALDTLEGIETENLDDFFGRPQRIRERFARMINAAGDEIGLVSCTSAGISALAHSLPLAPGDEVLIPRGEFPASAYAWLNAASLRQLEVRYVDSDVGVLPTEDLLGEIKPRTRVITCSLVSFSSGFRCDAEKIGRECRERGIFFILDGTQAVGALPVDVKAIGCAALACSGHKWLHSLTNTGYLYVSNELLPQLEPPSAHWLRYLQSDSFFGLTEYGYRPLADARKFEMATNSYLDLAVRESSLELLDSIGSENIRSHVFSLLDRLVEFLSDVGLEIVAPLEPVHRSTILCCRHPDAQQLQRYLSERKIIVSLREGAIRFSPSAFNTLGEIEELIKAVEDFDKEQ